jgi:hypothetical protein
MKNYQGFNGGETSQLWEFCSFSLHKLPCFAKNKQTNKQTKKVMVFAQFHFWSN